MRICYLLYPKKLFFNIFKLIIVVRRAGIAAIIRTPRIDISSSKYAYPHILVSGRAEARSPVDAQLARMGRKRRVGVVLPSFGMVPGLLRGSNMIAMLPSRVVPPAGDLTVLPPPIAVCGFPLHLAWHRRRDRDRALQHVVGVVAGLVP
ncbi:LysR substrate-binding domain-containing protein [Achromobacter sp. UBA2119]|uniref:LysR substrate-binding domain-containing protein n=1 Tax=Achromobacter sp. UBA2119 TaxID=1945911 RepID=UPI00257F7D6F|nr:LysR substrate-binding domain-containing protein [Achromobacter sp. UBA2119]